jgi:hypothetical protein
VGGGARRTGARCVPTCAGLGCGLEAAFRGGEGGVDNIFCLVDNIFCLMSSSMACKHGNTRRLGDCETVARRGCKFPKALARKPPPCASFATQVKSRVPVRCIYRMLSPGRFRFASKSEPLKRANESSHDRELLTKALTLRQPSVGPSLVWANRPCRLVSCAPPSSTNTNLRYSSAPRPRTSRRTRKVHQRRCR